MNRNLKIISGGQTGADLAGLWAARIFGVETGGYAPKDWKTQMGSMPQLGEFFGLYESENGYHGRTLQNCEASNLTLIFASNIKSPGTKLTLHHCITNNIRYRIYSFKTIDSNMIETNAETITGIINRLFEKHPKLTINVAGNSTATSELTFKITFLTMCKVLKKLGLESNTLCKYEVSRVEEMLHDCYDQNVYDSLHNIFRSNN